MPRLGPRSSARRQHGDTRAILLDALGTLVALEPPAPLLRAELARAVRTRRVSEREAERAIGAEIAYYRAHLDEGRDAASLQALRRRCAEVLRSALPVAPPRGRSARRGAAGLAAIHPVCRRRSGAEGGALAGLAARGGEQLGCIAARRLARAGARAAARRHPHLGGGGRAQACAGDLRAGAGARRCRRRRRRSMSATASRRTSPAPAPPASSRCSSAGTVVRPCPAYARSLASNELAEPYGLASPPGPNLISAHVELSLHRR